MKDQIHVSTKALEADIEKLKVLSEDWGDIEAPSKNVDTRQSDDDVDLKSEGKTIEQLRDQVIAARRAQRYFADLIKGTANYLGNTKDAFIKTDNE